MSSMFEWLEPMFLIKTLGMLGLFGIIFAESGLLIGFFFPGDSLLFTAGFLASQGYLEIVPLLIGCFVAAVLGDSVGYAFGRRVGPRIFTRSDSLFFHKDHLIRAQKFYETQGGRAIILARFLPVIRTFAPILAGVGMMNYSKFLAYNLIGGAIWALGLTSLGYYLGNTIPNIDRYLLPIILVIITVSMIPAVLEFMKHYRSRRK